MHRRLVPALALAGACASVGSPVHAQRACADDRPCWNQVIVDQEGLYFDWDDVSGRRYSHYNVRWSRPGRDETQAETRNEFFVIRNPHSRTTYTLKVQGCRKPTIGSSTCSPWIERQYTTR